MRRDMTSPSGSKSMRHLRDAHAIPCFAIGVSGTRPIRRDDASFNAVLKAYADVERDDLLVEALAWWVARMRGPMTIGALLRMARLGEGSFAAAVALLGDGRLVPVSQGRIWNEMLVAPPSRGNRDALRTAA